MYNYKHRMKYLEFYSQYVEMPMQVEDKEGFTHGIKCVFPEEHINGDKKPSVSIDLETGVYLCPVCGTFGPAKFLMKKMPELTPPQANAIVDEYRRDHSIIEKVDTFAKTVSFNPKFNFLYEESQRIPLEEVPMALEYAESRGITLDTLRDLKVGWLPKEKVQLEWKRDSLVFPYFLGGKVVGIRYRDIHGSKGGEKGSYLTLWGADDLSDDGEVAVLVEGESDRLRTYQELKKIGFKCDVVSSPTGTFRYEWVREFEGYRKVVVIHQGDEVGFKMAEKASKALGEKYAGVSLRWKRQQRGKDICEWLDYNTGDDLKVRIESVIGDGTRRIMTGHEFAESAGKPRQYLINNLLARQQVAVIAGPPKNMKTWLVLNLIRSIITGEEFAGIPNLTGVGGSPRILLIEEEGDAEELRERLDMVMGDINWKDYISIGHHLGCRLDEESWIDRIEKVIAQYGVDLVVFDPLQRMHGSDENSASEMGEVWTNIHRLTSRFKSLGVVVLHHFNKAGDVNTGWNALRGSIRTAAEADLGLFVEKRAKSEGLGVKVRFDGRTLKNLETPDGKEVFKLGFDTDTGRLDLDLGNVVVNKRDDFMNEMLERGQWSSSDICSHYQITATTLSNWITALNERNDGRGLLHRTPAGRGNPAMVYVGGKNDS